MSRAATGRPPLTEEQRKFLATPDAELHAQCAVMSFDTDRLEARVSGDTWQNIIQSHLYFDHIITNILSENVPNPRALKLDRIEVSQKLDLLSALELIETPIVTFLRTLNQIRNNIIHNLDFDITEDHISSLINTIPTRLKSHIKDDTIFEEGVTIRKALVILIIFLDLQRQNLCKYRISSQKQTLRLKAVVSGETFEYVE